MAETIYDDLLRKGQEHLEFRGFLDSKQEKAELKARGSFNTERNRVVYLLLQRGLNASEARDTVARDFKAIRADTPDDLAAVVDHVEAELATRIDAEAGKSPLRRRVVRWAPTAILVMLALLYVGTRFYSAVPIDQPMESRKGIEQRAAALSKAIRYQTWTTTRRNGLVIELLMWPIAPTEAETKGAADFAAMVFGTRAALARADIACGAPADTAQINDTDIELVERAADHVLKPDTKWLSPPVATLVAPIVATYPCK